MQANYHFSGNQIPLEEYDTPYQLIKSSVMELLRKYEHKTD